MEHHFTAVTTASEGSTQGICLCMLADTLPDLQFSSVWLDMHADLGNYTIVG